MSVSRKCGIDRRTVRRHQDAKVNNPGSIKLGRRWLVYILPQQFEADRTDLTRSDRQARFFGLTGRDVRKVAFEVPVINATPHPFKKVGP